MLDKFKEYLDKSNFSKNTVDSYYFAVNQFFQQYDEVNKKNLKDYKVWMIENYKPKTVNLRLRAINCYLDYIQKGNIKLPFVKIQQKTFLENVISEADYNYLKNCLQKDDIDWYMVIRFLAATGARVSELIQFKAEHVKLGYIDIYSKGGKLRRIYIPKQLKNEALDWLSARKQESDSHIHLFGKFRLQVSVAHHRIIEVVEGWRPEHGFVERAKGPVAQRIGSQRIPRHLM